MLTAPSLTFGSPSYRSWLRREKIRARDRLAPGLREALSRAVVSRILASPEFRRAETVLLYRAVRGEVRLNSLAVSYTHLTLPTTYTV